MGPSMDIRHFSFVILGFGWIFVAQACDEKNIKRCQESFLNGLGMTPEEVEAGVIGDMSEERLTEICVGFDAFTDCLKPHEVGCSNTLVAVLNALEDMFDYICHEGFEDYIKHHGCLRDNKPTTDVCVEEMKNKMKDSFFLTHSETCRIINDGLECVVRGAERNCGAEAARYTMTVEMKGLKSVADNIMCQMEPIQLMISTSTTTTTTAHPSTSSTTNKVRTTLLPVTTTSMDLIRPTAITVTWLTTGTVYHYVTATLSTRKEEPVQFFATTAEDPIIPAEEKERNKSPTTTTTDHPGINPIQFLGSKDAHHHHPTHSIIGIAGLIGIVICVLLLLIIAIAVIFYITKYQKRKRREGSLVTSVRYVVVAQDREGPSVPTASHLPGPPPAYTDNDNNYNDTVEYGRSEYPQKTQLLA